MKKIIVICLLAIISFGCSDEEVFPVVSNIDLQVGKVTYNSANEYGNLVHVDYDVVQYQITFEPYRLKSDVYSNARIVVWQNASLKNDYFRKVSGTSFIDGGFYLESEIPLQSREEITISVYDVYDECDNDFHTPEMLEGYISTLSEVKYTIYVGNRKIETNTISLKKGG